MIRTVVNGYCWQQEEDAVCDGESRLREVRPSSLVARMMMNSVSNGSQILSRDFVMDAVTRVY